MSFVPSRVNANNVKFFPPLRYTVGKTTVYLKLKTGATSTDSLSPKLLALVIHLAQLPNSRPQPCHSFRRRLRATPWDDPVSYA